MRWGKVSAVGYGVADALVAGGVPPGAAGGWTASPAVRSAGRINTASAAAQAFGASSRAMRCMSIELSQSPQSENGVIAKRNSSNLIFSRGNTAASESEFR